MKLKRYSGVVIFVIIIIIIQITASLAEADYYLTQLTMAAYYSMVLMGLCMLMGYAGQISLGHAGFFAIGGYTSAVITTYNLYPYNDSGIVKFLLKIKFAVETTSIYGDSIIHLSPWIAFIFAIAITIIIAYLIGVPVLKLKGHYLAMATLGFGSIIYTVVLATDLFGGADGVSDLPDFNLFFNLKVTGDFAAKVQNYYIAFFWVTIGLLLIINLINSRVGRALQAIHGNEEAAHSIGINIAKYKIKIFVLSAIYAAIGGIFLTHYNGGIGPSEASVLKSVRYVALVAVGGMTRIWGVLIIGIILNYLSLRGYFGTYDDAVFGVILVIIMLFAPQGILSILKIKRKKTI